MVHLDWEGVEKMLGFKSLEQLVNRKRKLV